MPTIEGRYAGLQILVPVMVAGPSFGFTDMGRAALALLDTGSDSTGIGAHLARDLGLATHGKRMMRGATGERNSRLHMLTLGFQRDASAPLYLPDPIEAFDLIPNDAFDILIGMDVLHTCDLHLYRNRTYALTLP